MASVRIEINVTAAELTSKVLKVFVTDTFVCRCSVA